MHDRSKGSGRRLVRLVCRATGGRETPATIVAGGGYFGPPTASGLVEIGYSVCPEWRGRGYATEVASALAAHVLRQPGVTRVQAQTTPANVASVRVLERSGFVSIGVGTEPGTVRFDFVPLLAHD